MASQFERDKWLVELFMQRQGWGPFEYHDPNIPAGRQTGVDVLVVSNGLKDGFQVTEIDTGRTKGRARNREIKAWRNSQTSTYAAWPQNDPGILLGAIRGAILKKVEIAKRHDFKEFDCVRLLVSAGIPEMGSVASTLIVSLGLSPSKLDAVTLDCLAGSKYEFAYLHCILDVEHALYIWQKGGRWEKQIQQEPAWAMGGPSFWDIQKLMR
jgi:hypothetical protein